MESRMWGNSHVRFGERDAGIRTEQPVDGARVPTLRDPSPSRDDIALTRKLVDGGKLLDIVVHDHLVLGAGSAYVSLQERGLLS
jgi:RadC-like JAB domain-containing protein